MAEEEEVPFLEPFAVRLLFAVDDGRVLSGDVPFDLAFINSAVPEFFVLNLAQVFDNLVFCEGESGLQPEDVPVARVIDDCVVEGGFGSEVVVGVEFIQLVATSQQDRYSAFMQLLY